ncbi:MAG TPA: response regulator [Blastocatellia bacterium]|nr:response regulator [Blastocatellia bacterium]
MGCKILLADDSITIQKVVNLTFDDEGIEVVAVSNGDQAERKLGEVKPDLVLADIFMPGKNGYELCEIIKRDPQFSNVPVVLLVGAFEPFDLNEARRVGADDHLTKPFESRKLVETVRRLISIREQNRPSQPPAAAQQEKSDRATDSLEDRAERTTDPLDAKPFMRATDLYPPGTPTQGAAGETAAPERDVVTGASDAAALNEIAPLELDYTPAGEARDESPDADFHFSSPEETGDLSTESFNDEIAFETTPLDDMEFPPSKAMHGPDDARPQAESSGQEPHSFSFGESTDDFDKLDAADPSIGRQTLEWASDAPAWQPSLHDSSRMEVSSYAASEAAESSSATLLAVEDPLGDVLQDEAMQQQTVFEGRWQPTETTEEPVLNLDFPSPEAAMLPPLSEVAPEYAASHPDQNATFAEAPADVEQPPVEPELVFNPEEHQPVEAAQTEGAEPHADFDQVVEPGFEAKSYETQAFQPAAAEPAAETGEGFTSSAMWTEEESRFAPIDIEAVPVDEAEADRAVQPHPVEQETGFEFSQIIPEEPAASPEYPPPAEVESEPTDAGQPASQVVDLSQSAIDEIVKRVVAELSDRVVREIAWEVIPDLVERVVEKLARESLSKRT